MQRLLPFAKTLVHKTLVQKTLAQNPLFTTPLYSRKAPTTLLGTLITRNRNFCSGGPENPNPKNPLKDPWKEPWDEDAAKYSWDIELPASEEEKEPEWMNRIRAENEDGGEGIETVRNVEEGGVPEGGFGDAEKWAEIEKEFAGIEKEAKNNLKKQLLETPTLISQALEPGLRGAYLKDSEKQEMYRLHKENPEVYTVERLAKDFRIMRQRVHAILWLKEDEEEMEKRLGRPLDDAVDQLLDALYMFIESADREFHVAELPANPDFKVMPENWDGTLKDPDEMLWEISQKEDEMLYQEFVRRMNYNKAQIAGKIKCHPYSRRRPSDGWNFTVEELGPKGKRGRAGGRKFVSKPDGSKRPLNELEKMFLKRETNRMRRKII